MMETEVRAGIEPDGDHVRLFVVNGCLVVWMKKSRSHRCRRMEQRSAAGIEPDSDNVRLFLVRSRLADG